MSDLGDNLSPQKGEPSPLKQGKNMGPKALAKTTRRIMLEDNEDIPPPGLYVGINGWGYLIKPGVVIDCPKAVIEVLDHAVISIPVLDPETKKIVGYRERLRFGYRNMDMAA